MATHDYIISNASGAAVRADLNNALAAIATNNSSATEPTTTYAYQWWADTGSSPTVMKLRNAANSGWITLFQLDGEWTVVPFENGTAAAPSIYFKDSGTDTGIYSPGADQVAITTGGTGRLFVDSSGRVLVGTSTSIESTSKLQVKDGSLNIYHASAAAGAGYAILFTTDGNSSALAQAKIEGLQETTSTSGGRLVFSTSASGSGTPTERVRITSTGRVGISSTAPAVPLEVVDTIRTSRSGSPGTYIEIFGGSGSADPYINVPTGFGIPFRINNTERARIDSSGRLLVGTSTSTNNLRLDEKLAVVSTGSGNYGGATFTNYGGTSALTAPILDFQRSRGTTDGSMTAVASGDTLGYMVFRGSDGTGFANGAYISAEVDGSVSTNIIPGRLTFATVNTGGTTTERMRITNDGYALIGTTTVGGSTGITLHPTGYIIAAPTYSLALSSAPRAMYMDSSGYFGYVSSTRNSKENIQLQSSVDWLYQLEPVTFNYKIKDRETGEYTGVEPDLQFGLIAEDVEAVCPELCFYDETENGKELRGISYEKLITPMLKALQQANQRIEALEAEVAALKSQ